MNPQHEKIREVQKEAWNKSSHGWKKWDLMMMGFLKPVSDEMIRMLEVKEDDVILDVATGTGEPGLTIASILHRGNVIGTDLSEEMLRMANRNAIEREITNFQTLCCDVSELPFEDHSFDAVSCRFGFMFFPDMQLALKEMIRVLKPGGKVVTSVWDVSEKNSWINTSMEPMISMLQLTAPAPGAPGLFRCAQQGFVADLFRQAGLKNIEEKEVRGKLFCGPPETYWSFITEAASPTAFSKADEAMKQRIKETVLGNVSQKFPDGNIVLASNAIVVCGEK